MSSYDRVSLVIGGQRHSDWLSYSIDSDLLIPADAWQFRVAVRGVRPAIITRAASVSVMVGEDVVLMGRIDAIKQRIDKQRHELTISGRDLAAILVDCSAPIFSGQFIALSEIISKIVKPLGIKSVKIFANNARIREKINVEPGETAWQALQNAAEANGLWPWMEPDGTLVVGGPDYNAPAVATLVMRTSGLGNNVEDFEVSDDIAQAFSEVTVLSQTRGSANQEAAPGIKRTYRDPALAVYRPKIVVDHESDNAENAQDRARKLQQDSRLKSYTLKAVVGGHRINAPGEPGHDTLWQPGQRVHVVCEPLGIDEVYFLMGRTFVGGRDQPTRTILRLKEDAMWIVEARPHNRKQRRAKKAPGQAQILQVQP